jgi:hypothetical protein
MKPDWSTIRGHYEATGEPLRAVAKRFEIPFQPRSYGRYGDAYSMMSSLLTE